MKLDIRRDIHERPDRKIDQTCSKLLQTFQEANARLREEIDELRTTNVSLRTRVEELEKPHGLRALLLRLMFWASSCCLIL